MMQGGIFSWLIIGLVIYLLFFRRGGMMGCCGGHNHHSAENTRRSKPHSGRPLETHDEIIDLKKEDYYVQEGK